MGVAKKANTKNLVNLDIIGKRFGRLIILELVGINIHGKAMFNCICDCGKQKVVTGSNLKRKTKSCGCLRAEWNKLRNSKPIKHLCVTSFLNQCKRRSTELNMSSDIDYKYIEDTIFSKCFYCKGDVENVGSLYRRAIDDGRRIRRLGLDRIDNNVGYIKSNCVPCCRSCNIIKMDHDIGKLEEILEKMLESIRSLNKMEMNK